MKFLVICALVSLAAARFQYTQEFQEWKVKFNKQYADGEESKRQTIWESNKVYVDNHNKNSVYKFTLEMNEFADLDVDEFSRIYNGFRGKSSTNSTNVHKLSGQRLAQDVDWRDKGIVTPIKNQGHCGSCWSFSTTGSVEGQYALKYGTLKSFSEQQLVDCSKTYGNHGCKGGLMDNAFRYLRVYKDELESSYPYTAEDGLFCKYQASLGVVGLTGYTDIPRGSESALLDAAGTIGPISVAIDAGHRSFQLYKSGVYYEPECSSTKLNHGVLVVGYGVYEGEEYWLVKNSWGPIWGLEGYVRMKRNYGNMCGIATQASYPIVA